MVLVARRIVVPGSVREHLKTFRFSRFPCRHRQRDPKAATTFVSIKRRHIVYKNRLECMYSAESLLRWVIKLHFLLAISRFKPKLNLQRCRDRDMNGTRSPFHQIFSSPLLFSTRNGLNIKMCSKTAKWNACERIRLKIMTREKSGSQTLKSFSFGALWTRSRKEFIN